MLFLLLIETLLILNEILIVDKYVYNFVVSLGIQCQWTLDILCSVSSQNFKQLPVKLASGECPRTSLMISQHWFSRPANHYAFCVITTHFECQIRHYASLSKMWENYAFCEISEPSDPGIRPITRNLQQLSRLVVSRKSPAVQNIVKGQLRTCLFYDYHRHRRQISPSDQQRKLQRWNHAQWNVEPIVNRSNAGGSSPTWSPASPV